MSSSYEERAAYELQTKSVEAETAKLKAEAELNNSYKGLVGFYIMLARVLGPALGHSLVWATAAVLIVYILAVMHYQVTLGVER